MEHVLNAKQGTDQILSFPITVKNFVIIRVMQTQIVICVYLVIKALKKLKAAITVLILILQILAMLVILRNLSTKEKLKSLYVKESVIQQGSIGIHLTLVYHVRTFTVKIAKRAQDFVRNASQDLKRRSIAKENVKWGNIIQEKSLIYAKSVGLTA